MSVQWVNDIMTEFVYQFQGFCQFRCQVGNHSPETIKLLQANIDVWNLPTVIRILTKLISLSQSQMKATAHSSYQILFGYFATIELARLECLLGDFGSSLKAISSIKLNDRTELFQSLPFCHFNVYYHTGVSNMMLRRFVDAMDVFGELILHVSRILKPGASGGMKQATLNNLQRMLDKVLSLTAILITVFPSYRPDDQIRELVEVKFGEKMKLLQSGSTTAFTDLFESSSPKFISPAIPDYFVPLNVNNEAFNHAVSIFSSEVEQHLAFLRLRSYLGLYSALVISKLSPFHEISPNDLICQFLSFKHKAIQSKKYNTSIASRSSVQDVQYFVEEGVLVIADSGMKNSVEKLHERFFISGIRKHAEIIQSVTNAFNAAGI